MLRDGLFSGMFTGKHGCNELVEKDKMFFSNESGSSGWSIPTHLLSVGHPTSLFDALLFSYFAFRPQQLRTYESVVFSTSSSNALPGSRP